MTIVRPRPVASNPRARPDLFRLLLQQGMPQSGLGFCDDRLHSLANLAQFPHFVHSQMKATLPFPADAREHAFLGVDQRRPIGSSEHERGLVAEPTRKKHPVEFRIGDLDPKNAHPFGRYLGRFGILGLVVVTVVEGDLAARRIGQDERGATHDVVSGNDWPASDWRCCRSLSQFGRDQRLE